MSMDRTSQNIIYHRHQYQLYSGNSFVMASSTPSKHTGDSSVVSLLEFLDLSQLNCLNESSQHTLKSITGSKSRNASSEYLLSDADEQLLLNIPFNQAVRIHSILFQTSNESQAPHIVKIFANRPSIGFEDVEDAEEPDVAQALTLSKEEVLEGKPVSLRFVRFQHVNSLHIFVALNHGRTDETRIDCIDIFGFPVETTKDLSGLRNQDD
ncbi:PITH domain-containing protein [Crucibulum laeve]|uniref:PITH domain-containing protein n=1 Tax=Crucibulum laeve TaxID=68775 RepID=A0A5C3MDY5_9AGAR|nr:PITH domain-containing protein [Crucibulum laeve]